MKYDDNMNVAKQMDWDAIKDKVVMRVLGADLNKEKQNEIPCRNEGGLLLTYQVLLMDRESGSATYQITNPMLKGLDVTEQELYDVAIKNTPNLLPVQFNSMERILEELLSNNEAKGDFDTVLDEVPKNEIMYVLSNQKKQFGAAAIFYPEVMEKIADAFGKDIIILPSSVHENILVPYDKNTVEIKDLKAMVVEVNKTQVEPEERLSNQVFVYDKDAGKIMLADKWREQKKEKTSIKDKLKENREVVVDIKVAKENTKFER